MATKFDVEDSTGVVEVKIWLDNGNELFMVERRAACRYALCLAVSWLYSPMCPCAVRLLTFFANGEYKLD
jgi:hypothetical protein